MYTITFYSFKGGVGRTLALVNVAAELARMGRKVLLVDFDLEAPGLETFERLRPPQPHLGLVEYVTEYMYSKRSPDVRDYIYSPVIKEVTKKGGQLWVMPAGRRDANYQYALTRLNWKKLYDDDEGFLFFEDTKAQWEQEYKPDYVLIDSRTGHTDVKGICTRQLPDVVVVLFFPNEQNLVGLRAVCQEIRAEREQGLEKTIGLHFVMSNVPDLDDEDKVLRRRLQAFNEELGIRKLSAIIHRYESVMLFNQAIFVLDKPKSRLAREYRKLTRVLIRHNPADRDGALEFLRRSDEVDHKHDIDLWDVDLEMVDQGLPAGEELYNKILAHFFDKDADVLYEMATCQHPGRKDAERRRLLDQALALRPDHPHALFTRAQFKMGMGTNVLPIPPGRRAKVSDEVSGAAADLLQYLRDHGFESPHGPSALRDLREIAPERLSEAVDCAIARGIGTEGKYQLARFLAETDAELSRAIQFMRDYLADESSSDKVTATFLLQSYLIRVRRWGEVVDLHDAKAVAAGEASSWAEPFNVAMAHWAQSGIVPEGIAKEIGQRLVQNERPDLLGEYKPLVCAREGVCWFLWWRGDNQTALHSLGDWIEQIEKWIKDRDSMMHLSWWSFWRYQGVQLSQYRDDLQQLHRMIQGEPIRPPFLGDSTEAR
jgi:MinD-like ATPase involved in chromosome partitioning or flagellar assembly